MQQHDSREHVDSLVVVFCSAILLREAGFTEFKTPPLCFDPTSGFLIHQLCSVIRAEVQQMAFQSCCHLSHKLH